MARAKRKNGTFDSETDPFLFGRVPEPFVFGVYVENEFKYFWGKKCIKKFVDYLMTLRNQTLYAHNGGKFDFHFLIDYVNKEEIKIINGRIAEMWIGDVILKDSFLLMPFALAAYKKTDIDYNKFETGAREKHKTEIVNYLKDDCIDLHTLLTGFHDTLGNHLTIGGAAFANMKKLGIQINAGTEANDERYRKYFFGGRTQAFEKGDFKNRPFYYIDINSAYPYAMCHQHPHGYKYQLTTKLPRRKLTCEFISFIGKSIGALPVRTGDGTLDYPVDHVSRLYHCTGWELQAGLDTKTISIERIIQVHIPLQKQTFKKFVDYFYPLKNRAKKSGDFINELAFKFCLNSGYGKFATDPRKFKDYRLAEYGDYLDDYGWDFDIGSVSVYSRGAYTGRGFYDVAVGASITGFVRAYMWRAILTVKKPIYCDTDSIICESFNRKKLVISDKLGDWSLDAKGDKFAIAGKKLYTYHDGEKWHTRSKGAKLTSLEVRSLCHGKSVKWRNDAPSFNLRYGARFTERLIKQI